MKDTNLLLRSSKHSSKKELNDQDIILLFDQLIPSHISHQISDIRAVISNIQRLQADPVLYKQIISPGSRSNTYEWYDEVNEILTVVNITSDEFTVSATISASPAFLTKEDAREELRFKTTFRLGKEFIRILARNL